MKISFKEMLTVTFLLYGLSIGVIIIPSLLYKPVVLGNIFAFIILILRIKNLKIRLGIKKSSNCFFLLIIYLGFYAFFSFSHSIDMIMKPRLVLSIINLTFFAFLFSFILLTLSWSELQKVIQAYVVFAFVMSLFGLVAWILLHSGYVQKGEFAFNLFDATNGKMKRDEVFKYGGYDAPYNLGLILTRNMQYNFFGFWYWRASGWAHEPTTATLFVTPALIILALNNKIFSKVFRKVFFITILCFWFACSAVGSIVAVLILTVFGAIIQFMRSGRAVAKVRVIITIVVVVIGIAFIGSVYDINDTLASLTVIKAKFYDHTGSVQQAKRAFFWFLYPVSGFGIVKNIMLYLYILFMIIQSLKGILKGEIQAVYGYTCLYFILHALKGSWYHVPSFILTLFFFYILIFHRQKSLYLGRENLYQMAR